MPGRACNQRFVFVRDLAISPGRTEQTFTSLNES